MQNFMQNLNTGPISLSKHITMQGKSMPQPMRPTIIKPQSEEKQFQQGSKHNIINNSSSITAGNVKRALVHPQNSHLQRPPEEHENSSIK
jgi:hypothetical protein